MNRAILFLILIILCSNGNPQDTLLYYGSKDSKSQVAFSDNINGFVGYINKSDSLPFNGILKTINKKVYSFDNIYMGNFWGDYAVFSVKDEKMIFCGEKYLTWDFKNKHIEYEKFFYKNGVKHIKKILLMPIELDDFLNVIYAKYRKNKMIIVYKYYKGKKNIFGNRKHRREREAIKY